MLDFYPRSPCGERLVALRYALGIARFLSTLSLRRATIFSLPLVLIFLFLSTLSLRRATLAALRWAGSASNFYPRSPCGERLPDALHQIDHKVISIHALLAESDGLYAGLFFADADFYPRSPCGERRSIQDQFPMALQFLSTLSLRRATRSGPYPGQRLPISIHALLAESDRHRHGGKSGRSGISIHALLAESDHAVVAVQLFGRISIHALLAESDPDSYSPAFQSSRFLSTLSLRRATQSPTNVHTCWLFLSTLSLRRATYFCGQTL